MSVPYEIKNVAMDNTIKSVKLEPAWISVVVKMRETNVDLLVYPSTGSNYLTVAQGTSLSFTSYNFSAGNSSDYIKVKAASGTLEIIGFTRE